MTPASSPMARGIVHQEHMVAELFAKAELGLVDVYKRQVLDDVIGQTELGDAVHQHAARNVQGFVEDVYKRQAERLGLQSP